MSWKKFFSLDLDARPYAKFNLAYYLKQENLVELEQYLANNPNLEMDDREGNTPLHWLCHKASSVEFFCEAWTLLVNYGYPVLVLNKALESPLHKLIFSNPNFYDTGRLKDVFFFLVPKYYTMTQLPCPYDSHSYYFFQAYRKIFSNPLDLISEHPVARYHYLPRSEWINMPVPDIHVYRENKKIFQMENLEELTCYLTNRKCKSFKKFIKTYWDQNEFKYLKLISFISHLKLESYQVLDLLEYLISHKKTVNLGEKGQSTRASEEYLLKQYNWALTQMPYSKFKKIFFETPYYNEDTISLMQQMFELELPLKLKNFKSAQQLHDFCSQQVNRVIAQRKAKELSQLQGPFTVQQEKIKSLNQVEGLLEIIIPKTPAELIYWGGQLNICVGSLPYIEQVAKEQLFIVLIKKQSREYACCSLDPKLGIKEFKLARNQSPEAELYQYLSRKIKLISPLD